ncbi:E3 ubiquitin-protein ligase TRIM39-like isoform X2 [Phaenicophaeus curvirostris]|uniref:E3 ubiquitin-protein ligase TRIM39-like isoform X2 n=1 Tax=Phaenicophaeus curvirostris TaxID=33595 RepID=UPI0037F0ED57
MGPSLGCVRARERGKSPKEERRRRRWRKSSWRSPRPAPGPPRKRQEGSTGGSRVGSRHPDVVFFGGKRGFWAISSSHRREEEGDLSSLSPWELHLGFKAPAGREVGVEVMAFSLKPRPCTWDLALDYEEVKQFEVDVTLDPATAGPEVLLSDDLKEATWGRAGCRWPAAPGRFDADPCVVATEGFTSGRHYWQVEATGRFWAVGVAQESLQRRGRVLFRPNAALWALQKYDELCVALTAPSNTYVPFLDGDLGVFLDYEVGQVSFYAVATRRRIFTFRAASFGGQKLFPYFAVLLSTIKLSPRG